MNAPPLSGYQRFRDALAEANDARFYPAEIMDHQILHGLAWPVIGEEAAMVVGIRLYPGGARVGHIKAAAGDLDELVHVLAPKAEDWAREHGCHMALLEGRIGWGRVLRDEGWRLYQASLLKDL